MGGEDRPVHDRHADADARESRVDQVLVVVRAVDERLEQAVGVGAHAHVLAQLAPVRGDPGGQVRPVRDRARGGHVGGPLPGDRGQLAVDRERAHALGRAERVDLGHERGFCRGIRARSIWAGVGPGRGRDRQRHEDSGESGGQREPAPAPRGADHLAFFDTPRKGLERLALAPSRPAACRP